MLIDEVALQGGEHQGAHAAALAIGLCEEIAPEDDIGEEPLGEFGGQFALVAASTQVAVDRGPVASAEFVESVVAQATIGAA